MDIKKLVYDQLTKGKSIFLVGSTDSGKSYFVINDLINFIEIHGQSVKYFHNCDKLPDEPVKTDYLIIDEIETLQDKEILEKLHPEEIPYYPREYIDKISNWFKKLSGHKQPCVYIITRNDHKSIEYLIKNVNKSDWDQRPINVINFIKNY